MLFCKPLRSKLRYKPNRVIGRKLSFTEFEKAEYISVKDWNEVIGTTNYFFQIPYLKLIEQCSNVSLRCRYVLIYKNLKPCGIIYFQLTDFKANTFGQLLESEIQEVQSKRLKLFEKYLQSKEEEDVLFRMLTCGNNLISGEYGFLKNNRIKDEEFYKVLCTIIKTISSEEDLRGKISAVLIKDFYKPIKTIEKSTAFKGQSFSVEPNLVLEFPEGVKTLEEYILLFSKKYRNRAKSILKLRQEFEIKLLTASEIEKHQNEIYKLYENVYNRAKFKLLKLPKNYFYESKVIFEDKFLFKAFFNSGKLVGFSTWFEINKDALETHYIGLDYEVNENLNLYQNILYDYIDAGIRAGVKAINFGRTAAEIKTTIGAKPKDLICYIQPQNTLSKILVSPFIEFLKPKQWIPRNPFKEEQD